MTETTTTEHTSTRPLASRVIGSCLMILVLFQGWQVFAAPSYEYTVIAPKDAALQDELQRLGASGWEIVSSRRAIGQDSSDHSAAYELILKRRTWWLTSLFESVSPTITLPSAK